MRDALYILAILTGALLFSAPIIIAHWRQHPYRWPITVIDLVLGWTGVGWFVCLVWALWPDDPTKPRPIEKSKPVKLTRY